MNPIARRAHGARSRDLEHPALRRGSDTAPRRSRMLAFSPDSDYFFGKGKNNASS